MLPKTSVTGCFSVRPYIVADWQARVDAAGGPAKPVMQSVYIDLLDDPEAAPQPIHLGFRSGVNHLRAYLASLREIGINHVALNLRFNRPDPEATLKKLSDEVLPHFN